jgi:hypothetical protein
MNNHNPAFLITIDVEGDNLWSHPERITTNNSAFLPRFQKLCEKYQLKPTWLTNYEMAQCPVFTEFGQDVIKRNVGEIGMHLHAWNSPPQNGEGDRGYYYLIECSKKVMKDKIGFLTNLLEEKFQRKMVSHRAGRWAFNSTYAQLLVEHGYLVDCSVTPFINWEGHLGDPKGSGGSDYSHFPRQPYLVDLDQIDKPGSSSLLEIPVSIVERFSALHAKVRFTPSLIRRGVRRFFPPVGWLRPNGRNREEMFSILETARRQQWPCVEFMLHSSELMPKGSPNFLTPLSIDILYEDLELLFSEARKTFSGTTLEEFYYSWSPNHHRQQTCLNSSVEI